MKLRVTFSQMINQMLSAVNEHFQGELSNVRHSTPVTCRLVRQWTAWIDRFDDAGALKAAQRLSPDHFVVAYFNFLTQVKGLSEKEAREKISDELL